MGRVGDDAAIYLIIVKTREEPQQQTQQEDANQSHPLQRGFPLQIKIPVFWDPRAVLAQGKT